MEKLLGFIANCYEIEINREKTAGRMDFIKDLSATWWLTPAKSEDAMQWMEDGRNCQSPLVQGPSDRRMHGKKVIKWISILTWGIFASVSITVGGKVWIQYGLCSQPVASVVLNKTFFYVHWMFWECMSDIWQQAPKFLPLVNFEVFQRHLYGPKGYFFPLAGSIHDTQRWWKIEYNQETLGDSSLSTHACRSMRQRISNMLPHQVFQQWF